LVLTSFFKSARQQKTRVLKIPLLATALSVWCLRAIFGSPPANAGASGQLPTQTSASFVAPAPQTNEDAACAHCHDKIYRSYEKTAMARASGPSKGNVIGGEFTHKPSGVHYRVYEKDGKVWLSFDRTGGDEVHGKRELPYFIGSGTRGRTYIFEEQGFFFEAPVNWYGQKRVWDMTPAYQNAQHIPLTLPLSAECLSCHTNTSQDPLPGTENQYAAPIITQEGIGCARCHGPGEAHGDGKGAILNPAKLPPSRRDAVCMQCHLEGSVAIRQPEKRLGDYKPGENLEDYVHYYVLASSGAGLPAISQSEAFFRSRCKQKSGEAMSCISCHDPHSSPNASERVGYYRAKCLACHSAAFAAGHHAEEQSCIACHMPAVASSNVAHTQATDHRILRTPNAAASPAGSQPTLLRFPPMQEPADSRDIALAWQSLAEEGLPEAERQVEASLRHAIADRPNDSALLTALAFATQKKGDLQQAKSLYERALEEEPLDNVAAANLGVIAAQTGEMDKAIKLWSAAFQRQPSRSAIGVNLAKAFCAKGNPQEAEHALQRVLLFNPDFPEARDALAGLNANPENCSR
jgi:tetratricopeptide (TPR) repeat protein